MLAIGRPNRRARGGKFGRPDDVHEEYVHLRVAIAQLLGYQIVEFSRRLGPDFLHDFDTGMSSLEVGDDLLPDLGRFRLPGHKSQLSLRVDRRGNE